MFDIKIPIGQKTNQTTAPNMIPSAQTHLEFVNITFLLILNYIAFVPIQSLLYIIQHRTLITGFHIIDHIDQFPEHGYDSPIIFGAAFDVSTLPNFFHSVGNLSAPLLDSAGYGQLTSAARSALFRYDQILFVTNHQDGNVRNVPALRDLLS